MRTLEFDIAEPVDELILAPTGTSTRYQAVTQLTVTGGQITAVATEADLGLGAVLIAPDGHGPVRLHYAVADSAHAYGYPEAAFRPRDTRHTRAAVALTDASRAIMQEAGGGRAGIEALVAEAEARFEYGHPKNRFTDGLDAVPYLSCGLTPGSCVDINTYLVASLRAAGYEAAYLYGYFFPQERGGMTDDGHCWVATRYQGEILEWDIAHHIKAGLGPTRPGLNPRPGERVAVTHSMGHHYELGDRNACLKLLGGPMRIPKEGEPQRLKLKARVSAVSEKNQTAGTMIPVG